MTIKGEHPLHGKPHRNHYEELKHPGRNDAQDIAAFQTLYNHVVKDGALGTTGPNRDGVDGVAGPLTKAARDRVLREHGFEMPDAGYQRATLVLEGVQKERAAQVARDAFRQRTISGPKSS
jgi:hypothetical protein